MPQALSDTSSLADRLQQALATADFDALGSLLADDVRWGPPDVPAPPCRRREHVIAWYARAHEAGASAEVIETLVFGDEIVVGLRVHGLPGDRPDNGETDRWQVFSVRNGEVVDIVGFPHRQEALDRARGLRSSNKDEPARWAKPHGPLIDGNTELRLPKPTDAAVLHEYAHAPGALEGTWLPLAEDADLDECTDTVADWLAGWDGRPSFQGPAFAIVSTGSDRLIGQIGIGDRGNGVVELVYGVAPDQRGSGHASRAARLVARWLVDEGLADEVELRIDADATASQHVARHAGFVRAGTVSQFVPGTGETFEDLRFVWLRDVPDAPR